MTVLRCCRTESSRLEVQRANCSVLRGPKQSALVPSATSPLPRSNSVRKTTSQSLRSGSLPSASLPSGVLGPLKPEWLAAGKRLLVSVRPGKDPIGLLEDRENMPPFDFSSLVPLIGAEAPDSPVERSEITTLRSLPADRITAFFMTLCSLRTLPRHARQLAA